MTGSPAAAEPALTDEGSRAVEIPDRRRERQRRTLVNAIFLLFALSLVEGPLRKWFMPGAAVPLIFLRDPVMLGILGLALTQGFVLRAGSLLHAWALMAGVTIFLGGFQYLTLGPVGWGLGTRSYWLYVPLLFIVPAVFRRDDVMRLIRVNCWLSIPYAFLVAAQYNAGPASWLNIGVGGDSNAAVGLSDHIVRPFGLFTYTVPNVDYTAATTAMYMSLLVSNHRRRWDLLLLVLAGLAVCSMAVLTGSRSIYFLLATIILTTMAGVAVNSPDGRGAGLIIKLGIIAGLAVAVAFTAFPDMVNAMAARFEFARSSEGSLLQRALHDPLSTIDALSTATPLGYGIGIGAPGVSGYIGLTSMIYGEGDLQRNVNELGLLLGPLFLILRIVTAIIILAMAMRAARRGAFEALPLAGYALLPLAQGQITNSPLNAFLPWLCAGLCIASARAAMARSNQTP